MRWTTRSLEGVNGLGGKMCASAGRSGLGPLSFRLWKGRQEGRRKADSGIFIDAGSKPALAFYGGLPHPTKGRLDFTRMLIRRVNLLS